MKFIALIATLSLYSSVYSGEKSLCGADDRISDNDQKVGRIIRYQTDSSGCTATLIGKRCAITAGHCNKYVNFMEFDVPQSNEKGKWQHPSADKMYKISKIIDWENYGKGNDWMVFRMDANEITGQFPGDERGFYPVYLGVAQYDTPVRITGYGKDDEPLKNFTQQTAWGALHKVPEYSMLFHNVDTTGGNSGSAVINDITNEIIGIHTHSGCNYDGNKGTLISKVTRLKDAIAECNALH